MATAWQADDNEDDPLPLHSEPAEPSGESFLERAKSNAAALGYEPKSLTERLRESAAKDGITLKSDAAEIQAKYGDTIPTREEVGMRDSFPPDEIDEHNATISLVEVCERIKPSGRMHSGKAREAKVRCPFPDHPDEHPSATVNTETDQGYCHACCKGFDKFSAWGAHVGLDTVTQFPELKSNLAAAFNYAGPCTTLASTRTTPSGPDATDTDDAAFWSARPYLEHVRAGAHARCVSADAVLQAVLARVAAFSPYTLQLPGLVGTRSPLSYFAVIAGQPGVGKSAAVAVARELLPAPDALLNLPHAVADQLPIGTGEGLIESLFEVVEVPDPGTRKTRRDKMQVRRNAFVYADEGQVLTALSNRSGATIGPTLRSIFTGATLGQANASAERRRIVLAGNYTFGVVLALQETLTADLLDEAEGGTPQRFAWASGDDPTIPDAPAAWPGALAWARPDLDDEPAPVEIGVPEDIASEVREHHLGKRRGTIEVAALDGHRMLVKLKIAALLAVLDGRTAITPDDWDLADVVLRRSDRVRARVVAAVDEARAKTEAATTKRYARRAAESASAVETRMVVDCARSLANKVWKPDAADEITKRDLRGRATPSQRKVFEDAFDHAVAEGWIVVEHVPGSGTDKAIVKRGQVRP